MTGVVGGLKGGSAGLDHCATIVVNWLCYRHFLSDRYGCRALGENSMGLVGRILAIVAAANLIVLFIFVGLATLQFEAILSNMVRERLVVLATRTAVPFNSVVDLGLPVSSVRNALAVLEAAKQSDPAIEDITLFSLDGEIVHSTSDRDDQFVPQDWVSATSDPEAGGLFQIDERASFVTGIELGETNAPSARLAIQYSNAQAMDQMRAMAAKLSFVAGLLMIATIGFGALVLRFALAEHVRVLNGILSAYNLFERSFWRATSLDKEKPKEVVGLGISSANFWDQLWKSEQTYEAERNSIRPVDDGGNR